MFKCYCAIEEEEEEDDQPIVYQFVYNLVIMITIAYYMHTDTHSAIE